MTCENYIKYLQNFVNENYLLDLALKIHWSGFFKRPVNKKYGWTRISKAEFEELYNQRLNERILIEELNK